MSGTERRRFNLLYFVGRNTSWIFNKLTNRAVFFHQDRVPATGAYLLIANHQSFLDPPLIGSCITQRDITFMARASLFRFPVAGPVLRKVNAVPIRDGEGDIQAIRDIIGRLKKGEAVLMFPEGSRTFDGQMEPFRQGASLIMRRAKCPVIPIAIEGAFDAWPRTRKFPRIRGRTMVMYGHPIPPEELKGNDTNERLQKQIDDMRLVLRKELRRRSGGNYPRPGPGDHVFGSADSSDGSASG